MVPLDLIRTSPSRPAVLMFLVATGCWISPGDWTDWEANHGDFDSAVPEGDTDTDADADSDTDSDADADGDTDTDVPVDGDGDGWTADEDCDDGDASINPGAKEVCGDAVDNDCDGDSLGCATISGDLALSSADAVFAGEDTLNYAGASVSSAGDVDGDGFNDLLIGANGNDEGGTGAGAVYLVRGPVAGDLDLASAHAKLIGGESANVGDSVSGAGDVDGDGLDDLLLGAPAVGDAGTAYLVLGPVTGDMSLGGADATLVGEDSSDGAGYSVSGVGDVDGDGLDDLLIGASANDAGGSSAGAAYLVLGPVTGQVELGSADAKLIGEAEEDWAGLAVAGAGDVDGDGHDDLLVGARNNDTGWSDSGTAYLVLGPVTGELDLGSADARLTGEDSGDHAGQSVSGAGDVNGDGYEDVLVGSMGNGEGGIEAGAAYVVLGPVTGDLDLGSAQAKLMGESAADTAGSSLSGAGDIDGDGFDDLLVGASNVDTGGQNSGATYLLLGPVTGTYDLSSAEAKIICELDSCNSGQAVSGVGDMNNDGLDDVLVGVHKHDAGGSTSGAAFLFF